MRMIVCFVLSLLVAQMQLRASAEVVQSSEHGFQLSYEVTSTQSPKVVWERLMEPSAWWEPSHTFSGDADNLSMADEAGAFWREDWAGGSVVHGQIRQIIEGKMLMLSAPFGPLAGIGASCTWTITLQPSEDGGTMIRSRHMVTALPGSGARALAGPVDQVMSNGIDRLAASP